MQEIWTVEVTTDGMIMSSRRGRIDDESPIGWRVYIVEAYSREQARALAKQRWTMEGNGQQAYQDSAGTTPAWQGETRDSEP